MSNMEELPCESKEERQLRIDGTKRYNKYMKHVQNIDLSDFAPPPLLQHLETPFKWVQMLKNENLTSGLDCLRKMDDYKNQGDDYSYEKFLPYFALAFEYSLLKDFEEAKNAIQKLEEILDIQRKKDDRVYSRIGEALEHVLLATKTNILILENVNSAEVDVLKEKCGELQPLSQMSPVLQAGIYAVKAKFYLSCTTETHLVKENMMKATTLDPDFPLWKYWTGKILRKIRRDKREKDPKEEITYFEDAVQLEKNGKYVVYLAQAYREKAYYLFKNKDIFPELTEDEINRETDKLNETSCNMYMESVELNPTSAVICRRAGNGLMSLSGGYSKRRLAKHLLHKSEQFSMNPITYHILGTFYLRHEEDEEKALKYFQLSADNNMAYGYHEVLRIKYIRDPEYDPLEDFLRAEKVLEHSSSLPNIHGDMGWYYLIVQNNLQKAVEYFWRVSEKENENFILLQRFYSYTFLVPGPINMYKELQQMILKEERRDEVMVKFLEKVNSNAELTADSCEYISLARAQKEALSALQWYRKKQKTNKDRISTSYPERNNHYGHGNFMAAGETRAKERNWRTEKEIVGNNYYTPATSKENQVPYNKANKASRTEKEIVGNNYHTPATSSKENQVPYNKANKAPENWRLECRKF